MVQQQQLQQLQRQVEQQRGQPTPQQQAAHQELVKRDAALKQAAGSLQDSMKRDEYRAGGAGGALPDTKAATNSLPTSGLSL